MDAYIYRADIYCEECGEDICARLRSEIEAKFDAEFERAENALPGDQILSPNWVRDWNVVDHLKT
jgi:hypothetical protein